MDFVALVDQVIALLRQRGRVTYRTLQRQFELHADALADLLSELRYAHHEALHEDEQGLIWTEEARPTPAAPARSAAPEAQVPLRYTPAHLAEQILTSRSALAGERKQITVLFADLKDSTELIRGLDPEAAQQLLDPAIQLMMDAVHRFEGTVNQVLGDGIMALFGAPIAHEDHALRACYAALAMQAQDKEGLAQLRQGIAARRADRGALNIPYYCTMLADVCDHLGYLADGLQALAEAHTLVEQHEVRWSEAEVCRLQGVLLLRQTATPPAEAEVWWRRALDVARRQEAKSLELRAAVSLSRLWQQQGKQAEAQALLAPLYSWFTEGFDTADLQEARALLEELK
jgi:tetratricopeptide (TPR) repeat protein